MSDPAAAAMSQLSRRNSLPKVLDDNQYIQQSMSPNSPDAEKNDEIITEPHSVLVTPTNQSRPSVCSNNSPVFTSQPHPCDDTTGMVARASNQQLTRRPSLTAADLNIPVQLNQDGEEQLPFDAKTSEILLGSLAQRVIDQQ